MRLQTTRHAMLVLGAVAVTGLGACKKDNYAADSTAARADSAAGAAAARTDTALHPDTAHPATATSGGWNPNSIVSFATAANSGEIALARLAEKKATNAKVKAYARMLLTDHQAMLTDTKALGKKLNATTDTTTGDAHDLVNHANDEIKDLTDKAAGKDWDKNFIDKMIDDHQHVLDKLQDAAKNTTDASVTSALEKATGKVQEHLTKAQDIKANVLKD